MVAGVTSVPVGTLEERGGGVAGGDRFFRLDEGGWGGGGVRLEERPREAVPEVRAARDWAKRAALRLEEEVLRDMACPWGSVREWAEPDTEFRLVEPRPRVAALAFGLAGLDCCDGRRLSPLGPAPTLPPPDFTHWTSMHC